MLFVMPTLLGFGINPVVALVSTRPAIVVQSIIGLFSFSQFNDLNFRKYFILSLFSIPGAIFGSYILIKLSKDNAMILVLSLIVSLSIIASFKNFFIDNLDVDHGYFVPDKSLLLYPIVGFFPAVVGGIVGTGGGLVVVMLCFLLLRKGIQQASYIEKIVSLSHSSTIFVWFLFQNHLDLNITIVLFWGTIFGAYTGAKITLKLNVRWMYFSIVFICLLVLFKHFKQYFIGLN